VAVGTVKRIFEDWPGVLFDSAQQVVGYWGLSLPAFYDSPHKMTIDGRKLSAWCAWDTLFLPELLGQTAEVESISPSSGFTVCLTVTPKGVEQVNPAGTQMSFLLPASIQKDILSAFCCFVHFFPSKEAGESWVAQHDGAFLLSVEEAFAVAHRKNMTQYAESLR
jgi:alkylmercury lyase